MTAEPQRKRRKWDVADPGAAGVTGLPAQIPAALLYQPHSSTPAVPNAATKIKLDADAIKRAQEAAAAVVNKLNMEAVAKGTIPGSRLGVMDAKSDISREVFINDAPTVIRHHLTKKTTQDDVQRKTHTVIVTRGRYYPPGSQIDPNEKPLHLRITPAVDAGHTVEQKQQAVNNAAAEIQRILQGERQSADTSHASLPPARPSTTIPVGFEAPPDFGLSERITGPGGSYLAHISSQTGSSVMLKGRGSGAYEGPEPLHIAITAPTPEALRDAQRLATDLLQTVRNEMYRMYPHLVPPVPYMPGPAYPNAASAPGMYPPQAPGAYRAPPMANPYAANPYSVAAAASVPGQGPPQTMPTPAAVTNNPAVHPTPTVNSAASIPAAQPLQTPPASNNGLYQAAGMGAVPGSAAAPQAGYAYPPPGTAGSAFPAAGTAPNPYASMAMSTAPSALNPYSTAATSGAPAAPNLYTPTATSAAPTTALPQFPGMMPYSVTPASAPPNAAAPPQLATSTAAVAASLPPAAAVNPYAFAGATATSMPLAAPATNPQLTTAYQQPGYAPVSYPQALTNAMAPTGAAATWPTTMSSVPPFSGIMSSNSQQAAPAPANPYSGLAYAPPAAAANNGLQSAVGGISVALQTAVAGMQTAVTTMQNLVNARGAAAPQPSSPPKRRFREFKENAPQNQAPGGGMASAQSSSVYAQHFPALGTMAAAAPSQLPQALTQPQLQAQAQPQMQAGSTTGSVKVNAGIAGGLVDYEGDD